MSWLATSLLVNALLAALLLRQCRQRQDADEQVYWWRERYMRLLEMDERPILPFRRPQKEAAWQDSPKRRG